MDGGGGAAQRGEQGALQCAIHISGPLGLGYPGYLVWRTESRDGLLLELELEFFPCRQSPDRRRLFGGYTHATSYSLAEQSFCGRPPPIESRAIKVVISRHITTDKNLRINSSRPISHRASSDI